jgi:hypothetical protein
LICVALASVIPLIVVRPDLPIEVLKVPIAC